MSEQELAWVAGEASGDLLASLVMPEVARRMPDRTMVGVGGDRMIASGLVARAHSRVLSVRGYAEVVSHLPGILRLRHDLISTYSSDRPMGYIGVDAPDFNLGIEIKLREAGVPTVHFVSPSVWAWRPERIEVVRRAADHVLLIFPFEEAIYKKAGIPATYVGHPLARTIPMVPDTAGARQRIGLPTDGEVLSILPGSREAEVKGCGPVFFETAQRLLKQVAGLRIAVPASDAERAAQIRSVLAGYPEVAEKTVLVTGDSHSVLEAATVVLVASGTASLEAALYKKPMVVAYRMPTLTAMIMMGKIRGQWMGLPNILANERLVPELVNFFCTPQILSQCLMDAFEESTRGRLAERFCQMHESLLRDTPALAAEAIERTVRR